MTTDARELVLTRGISAAHVDNTSAKPDGHVHWEFDDLHTTPAVEFLLERLLVCVVGDWL